MGWFTSQGGGNAGPKAQKPKSTPGFFKRLLTCGSVDHRAVKYDDEIEGGAEWVNVRSIKVPAQETGAPIKQGRATSAPPSDGKGKTKSAFKGLVKKGTRWVKEVCHFGKKPKGAQPAATGVVITAPAAVKPELGAASAAESSATKPTPAAAPAAEAVVPKPTERSAQIVAIPPSPAPEPQPHFTVKDVAGLLKGAQKFRDVAVTAIARPLAQGLNHIVDIFGEDVKDGLIESLVDTVTGAGCIRVVEPCTPENQALLKAFKVGVKELVTEILTQALKDVCLPMDTLAQVTQRVPSNPVEQAICDVLSGAIKLDPARLPGHGRGLINARFQGLRGRESVYNGHDANSCFMNSLLQYLTHTPEIVALALSLPEAPQGKDALSAVLRHVRMAWDQIDTGVFRMDHVCLQDNIGTPQKLPSGQTVAQFPRCLQADLGEYWGALRDEMSETSAFGDMLVRDVWEGRTQTMFTWTVNGQTKSRPRHDTEAFQSIDLPLVTSGKKPISTLAEGMDDFCKSELMEKEFRIEGTPVHSRVRIQTAPKQLVVTFKRFEYTKGSRRGLTKYQGDVEFPGEFDLAPWMVDGTSTMYELHAVIVHAGATLKRGHYFAYIKGLHGTWALMNDNEVQQCTLKEALAQKQAYIVIYRKRTEAVPLLPPTPAPAAATTPAPEAQPAAASVAAAAAAAGPVVAAADPAASTSCTDTLVSAVRRVLRRPAAIQVPPPPPSLAERKESTMPVASGVEEGVAAMLMGAAAEQPVAAAVPAEPPVRAAYEGLRRGTRSSAGVASSTGVVSPRGQQC